MTDVDLNFLARQIERVLTELRTTRDDIRVLSAMVMRHDHTMSDILEELRAIHQWMVNMSERVRKLEDAQP